MSKRNGSKRWSDRKIAQSIQVRFKHPHAYMVMLFGCSAGHLIRIWNSRDDVIQEYVPCQIPGCQNQMEHIFWAQDQRIPHYKLVPGNFYFATANEETVLLMKGEIDEQPPADPETPPED